MFQTFSGSSRRPRQVNLSGQNSNPFAAKSWSPSGSGAQKTVANAQQERLQRQQERDRLNASTQIQRTWRGHRSRRQLADSRRAVWDQIESGSGHVDTKEILVEQVKLLVAFFSPRRHEDLGRLATLSSRISTLGYQEFLSLEEVQVLLTRLANATLEALQISPSESTANLLQLLVAIINQRPESFPRISKAYYAQLSTLVSASQQHKLEREQILTAIRIPLVEHIELDNNDETTYDAYASLALNFLTTPDLTKMLGSLDDLSALLNLGTLSSALVREFSSSSVEQLQSERRLWLLGHFISLHRLQRRSSQEPEYIRALSLQLSGSSSEIVGRIDATSSKTSQESSDIDDSSNPLLPLPIFVKDELLSLVNEESISGLLAKFNIDYGKASASGEEDASLLASYALTLLRIFPGRSDDIRIWLYGGSMTTSTGAQVPALKFFWQAMRLTNTFSVIGADPKAALSLLRSQTQSSLDSSSSRDVGRDREWRTILLFLELYTFVLRITDDEEFFSASVLNLGQAAAPTSRNRESALPLEDLKRLTIFLKNLAFTTYYNAGELSDDGQQSSEGGLATYFGTSTSTSRFQSSNTGVATKRVTERPFAGIAGMTFDYVRVVVTGVMRMLYERDSRRRFLPKDHWLMTSRFEMEGFIPDVVMEEERQHEVKEEGDEEDADDNDLYERTDGLAMVGMARPRRALQIESMKRQQQKLARQKILAAVGPRLEVLRNMPFVIPFETRVQIFREFVLLDQTRRRNGNVDPDIWRMSIIQQSHMAPRNSRTSGHELLGRHHAKIRRDQVFEDAYSQFYELGEGLKEPIQITFVDQFDTVEAGIDGGGVTKEFLTSVTNEAFRAEEGPNLFVANDQNLLYPSPSAIDERQELLKSFGIDERSAEWYDTINGVLRRYEFLGRVVGKCLYEGILVDIGFAGFFLRKWAASGASGSESGYQANMNDLRDLDEGLYQGLLKLKDYPGDVEDFSLDFTITDTVALQGLSALNLTRELVPGGSDISVTNRNRLLYVASVARHRLITQPRRQTQAFLRGLGEIINPSWLSMFNQTELQTLIGGDASEIDVEDLRRNTQYGGVYQIGDDGLEHPTVQLFWKVLKELDDSDRRKLLKYVTSTPRAPLLGFSQLNPRFSIRDAGSDEERLPSTSTCVNLLKLPRYSTAATLRSKLVYAVNSGAGFDLS